MSFSGPGLNVYHGEDPSTVVNQPEVTMWKALIVLVTFGMLLEVSGAEAQNKPSTERLSPRDPLTATARSGDRWIAGGYRAIERELCGPRLEAYLKTSAAGGELDLFTGLQSVDPRHVLASAVSAVALDPATGEGVAAVDLLLGWESAESAAPTTAQGVLLLRFSASGLLLRDAYLGTLPAGQPPASPCASHPPAVSALTASSLAVESDGAVVLRGRSQRAASSRVEALRIRLDSDLEVLASIPEERSPACPSVTTPSNLAEVKPLRGTSLSGGPSDLLYDDACVVNLAPVGEPFGLEAEFYTDLPPEALTFHVDLTFYDVTSGPILFQLESVGGSWVTIAQREPDPAGKVTGEIVVESPEGYVHPGTRISLRLLVPKDRGAAGLAMTPNAREDMDVDMLQMESEP